MLHVDRIISLQLRENKTKIGIRIMNINLVKKLAVVAVSFVFSLNAVTASAMGLPDNAQLTFTLGTNTINPVNGDGSWFGMEVQPGVLTYTAIGSENSNGIKVGTSQPATSANPNIDDPWSFFGNLGVHQTTSPVVILTDDGAGGVTLDFSGWDMSWNNIPSIPLGAGAHTGGTDGVAVVNCAANCAVGDTYIVNYYATVPSGDPSGFGGVKYTLHLEGVVGVDVPTKSVAIQLTGGASHECSSYDGNIIEAIADITTTDTNDITSINWLLDGVHAGLGDSVSVLTPVGSHDLTVVVNTVGSGIVQDSAAVEVGDSIPPSLGIRFINEKNGQEVTEVSKKGKKSVTVVYDVLDVCDPTPMVSGISSPVELTNNGDTITIKRQLKTSAVNVSAKATDASGNIVRNEALLLIVD